MNTTSPIANAGPDQTVNQGTIVIFNGSASYDNDEISNWTWTFRDGNQIDLHGMRSNYRFNVPGVYVVTLNVRDTLGLLNADMMKITVLDITPPIADAGPDRTVDEKRLSGSMDQHPPTISGS